MFSTCGMVVSSVFVPSADVEEEEEEEEDDDDVRRLFVSGSDGPSIALFSLSVKEGAVLEDGIQAVKRDGGMRVPPTMRFCTCPWYDLRGFISLLLFACAVDFCPAHKGYLGHYYSGVLDFL